MKKFGLRLTSCQKYYILIFAFFIFPNFKSLLSKILWNNHTSLSWISRVLRPKKVVFFPEIGRVKNILSLTRPHSRMCIRIYIFNFKNKKKTKITWRQKAKETKERKRISVENLTGYDDVVCEFAVYFYF